MLDLVGRPEYGGGLSNVATVIAELLQDDKLDQVELARVAHGISDIGRSADWMDGRNGSSREQPFEERATADDTTTSEIIREALRRFLHVA